MDAKVEQPPDFCVHANIDLDLRVGQQRPTEAAVFVAKKSGGGSTFVSMPIYWF